VAQFDRVIPPGGVGSIILKVNTSGYSGKVRWQTRIFNNDPANPVEMIVMEGILKPAIVFWPTVVFLKGSQNESIAGSVRIEGKLNKRLEIEPLSFSLAKQVNYKIVELEPGKVYEVRFMSVPNGGKRYRGFLKLKTGYEEKPEIVIPIWGDFAN
jgi:hypothetical protein